MIITRATTYVVPCGWRRAVLLKLETDTGLTGIGEAGIAYGVGGMAAAEMCQQLVERFVLGRDPRPVEAIWSEAYDNSFWTKGGGAISLAGLSAIDIALWDIKARSLGVPIHSLFGGPFSSTLDVYANGWWAGCVTPDDFARAAAATVAEGFRALKFYPLGTPDPLMVIRHPVRRALHLNALNASVARCTAIREAVGPDVALLLDFGSGLAMDQLLPLLARLEPLDIGFIEEPLDPGMRHLWPRLGQATSIPLAAGERLYGRAGFNQALAGGGISIAQPSICNTGGFTEGRKIAALAELHNMRVAPHNYGSTVATAVATQFAASIPNFMTLEVFPGFDREPDYNEPLLDPVEYSIADGAMPVPGGAGLGVEIDTGCLERFIHTQTSNG